MASIAAHDTSSDASQRFGTQSISISMPTTIAFTMDRSTEDDHRKMESMNERSRAPPSTFGEDSSPSDPHSSKFTYVEWLRCMFRDDETSRQNAIGVAYQNLNVYGFGAQTDYQKTFANYPLACLSVIVAAICRRQKLKIDILRDFEGLVGSGEMLLVLGRPGSGCSTLLKALSGQTHGLHVNAESKINFQGNCELTPFHMCLWCRKGS